MKSSVRLLWLLPFLLVACAAPPPGAPAIDPAQSILFYNGVVVTMDPDQPTAEALAVRGDQIEAVGASASLLAQQSPDTLLIDLAGRTLMPGFVDAHTHILNDAHAAGRSLDQAQYLALSNGITTLGDLYVDQPFLHEIQTFAARGQLRVRTSLYLVVNTNCGRLTGNWYQRYPPTRVPGEMLRLGGVKIFTDGGSCGGVALSFELRPGQGQGDLWLTQDQLNSMVAQAQAGGYQVAIHAIGDRAVEEAQTAIAAALAGGPNIYRHRLEHVSVLRPEQVARFGELGLIPVVPGQYPACTPFGPPVPEPYHAWEWPWRELRAANPDLNIAWHTDYPFASTNPFLHLYGFVTRTDVRSYYTCPAGKWLRDDTLPVDEALSIMTLQSAYALFRETEVGSLTPGKYADLVVVSGDPLTVPAAGLRGLTVLMTMVGGRVEFCHAQHPGLCPGYVPRTPLPLPDLRPPLPVRWLVALFVAALPASAGLGLRRASLRPRLRRLGSLAALVGGALWVWLWAWAMRFSPASTRDLLLWPLLAAGTLLALAVVGLAAAARPTRLGGLALLIAGLGIVIMPLGYLTSLWLDWDPGWLFIFVGLFLHGLGLVGFGLAHLRPPRPSALGGLSLAAGILGALLPLALGVVLRDSEWQIIVLGLALGLGWMALGLLLWKTKPLAAPASAVLSPLSTPPE
jgi:predicted amidohydrolase YtcJ